MSIKYITRLIETISHGKSKSFLVKSVSNNAPPPVIPEPEFPVEGEVDEDTGIKDFDYAIVRYSWTNANGRDLNTRTYLKVPDREQNMVGWARNITDSTYLTWNDNNTEVGVESILVNMKDIARDYPSQDKIIIYLRAWWYNSVVNGKVKIEFITYKGGQMVVSGYDWINNGGAKLQHLSLNTQTMICESNGTQQGQHLATLEYDVAAKTGKLIRVEDGNVEVPPIVVPKDLFQFKLQKVDSSVESIKYGLRFESNYTRAWQLYDAKSMKIVIASNQASQVEYIQLTNSPFNNIIEITLTSNEEHHFVFKSVDNWSIDLYEIGTVNELTSVKSVCEVIDFSTIHKEVSFAMYHTRLTVPSHLPPQINSMQEMFLGCNYFNQDISMWDVSRVNNMAYAFYDARSFNQDLSEWDVSHIPSEPPGFFNNPQVWTLPKPRWNGSETTTLPEQTVFDYIDGDGTDLSVSFYRDIPSWSLTKDGVEVASPQIISKDNVTVDMSSSPMCIITIKGTEQLHRYCLTTMVGPGEIDVEFRANAPLWNSASRLQIIQYGTTLERATHNTQAITLIVPESIPTTMTNLRQMFEYCTYFDQDLSTWDTSRVTDMYSMFRYSTFNGNISTWNVSNVTNMESMFENAIEFNQDLSNWRVENVSSTRWMFNGASAFNAPINGWNLTSVGSMEGMFADAISFNQPINDWDISTATTLKEMFNGASAFNQPLDRWDVSNITKPSYMASMFEGASSFNQDLSMWNVVNITTAPSWFDDAADAWVLPRPIWGTDGSALPVEPVVNGDTFEFTVISADSVDGNKPLTIHLGEGDSDWQLLADGEVIASPTFAAEGVVVDDEIWYRRTITLSQLRGRTVNYSLAITSSHVALGNSNDTIPLGQRSIKVTKFSNTTGRCEFALPNIELTVPNTIPSTFTSLKNMFEYCNLFNDPSVSDWDTSNITTMVNVFGLCKSFNQNLSRWSTHNVTDMTSLFSNCQSFNQDINNWSVSNVENMERLFFGCQSYNQPLDNWNTSLVAKMVETFRGCTVFNQDLSTWNVSNVNSFGFCFTGASAFNGDIASWDVSGAWNMGYMFQNAKAFNQDLSGWNVVNIASKPSSFDEGATTWTLPKPVWGTDGKPVIPIEYEANALVFSLTSSKQTQMTIKANSLTNEWDLYQGNEIIANHNSSLNGSVTFKPNWGSPYWNLTIVEGVNEFRIVPKAASLNTQFTFLTSGGLYDPAEVFEVKQFGDTINRVLFNITDTELVVPSTLPTQFTRLSNMFENSNYFNQDLSGWDVSLVTDMSYMFNNCIRFNGDVSTWDTSSVERLDYVFAGCTSFNQPVGNWNTSKVTNLQNAFDGCSVFNQNVSTWDVSGITHRNFIGSVFARCSEFNQDLSSWNVINIDSEPHGFSYATDKWILPKPIWGTNGGVVIIPDNALVFSLMGDELAGTGFEGQLAIRGGGWEIRDVDTYEEYASYSSSNDSRITNTDLTDNRGYKNGAIITFKPGFKSTLNLMIKFTDSWEAGIKSIAFKPLSTGDRGITLKQHSNLVNNISFDAPDTQIVVPPNLPTHLTSLRRMFKGCNLFNQDLSTWNVSHVTDMEALFDGASSFNQDLSGWDVSRVTSMESMFNRCTSFNQDLSMWNVQLIPSKPTSFDASASSWTLPKPVWGTAGVQPINYIPNALNMSFVSNSDDDRVLNLYIRHDGTESWYVQDVVNDKLIANSDGFKAVGVQLEFPVNQANKAIVRISHTDKIERHYSVVGNMSKIFVEHYSVKGSDSVGSGLPSEASLTIHEYSPNIAAYGFSTGYADLIIPNELARHITDLSYMFFHCWLFNQDLSSWDVSNVTDMSYMFKFATSFNQDLSSWNTSRVSSMESMFESAIAFNGNVTTWDVSKVTSTAFMFFSNVNFNQDISGWDTSNVTYMKSMFNGCASFNQDLSGWNVVNITVSPERFDYNADSWVLPKPNWGTDGTTPIAPPELELPDDPLTFTVENKIDDTGEKYLTVSIQDPVGAWELRRNGEAIVNSAGLIVGGTAIRNAPTSTIIKIAAPEPAAGVKSSLSKNSYALYGTIGKVKFGHDDAYPGEKEILFTMDNFSSDVKNVSLSLRRYAEVMVPQTLPSRVTSLKGLFEACNYLITSIVNWDVSNVTDFDNTFNGAYTFNQDISKWNIANATTLNGMFHGALAFNQDLSHWNVTKFATMPYEFYNSNSHNWYKAKPVWGTDGTAIENDNFANSIDMSTLGTPFLFNTEATNSMLKEVNLKIGIPPSTTWQLVDIARSKVLANSAGYTVEQVTSVYDSYDKLTWVTLSRTGLNGSACSYALYTDAPSIMFTNQTGSGYTIGSLNVTQWGSITSRTIFDYRTSKLTVPYYLPATYVNCSSMFTNCTGFNQDISGWDTSNVTNMSRMFVSATTFNQDLSGWNVSKIATKPTSFDTTTTAWKLPKPVWGSAGKPMVNPLFINYLPLKLDGSTGYVLTVAKNDGQPITINLTDPGLDPMAVLMPLLMNDTMSGLTFMNYPDINTPEGSVDVTKLESLSGFEANGNVCFPSIVGGARIEGPFSFAGVTIPAPLKFKDQINRLRITPTPGFDKSLDIYYSLPGSGRYSEIVLQSKAELALPMPS